MEIILQDKYKQSQTTFQELLSDSTQDIQETASELEVLQREIAREWLLQDSLTHDVANNEQELSELTSRKAKLQADFDAINDDYEHKFKDLEDIRLRANEEIRKTSEEMGKVQGGWMC